MGPKGRLGLFDRRNIWYSRKREKETGERKTLIFFIYKQEHKVDLKENKIVFKGKGEKEQNEYEAEIEFYGPVTVDVSLFFIKKEKRLRWVHVR